MEHPAPTPFTVQQYLADLESIQEYIIAAFETKEHTYIKYALRQATIALGNLS
jgi:DNA-binding phage protein